MEEEYVALLAFLFTFTILMLSVSVTLTETQRSPTWETSYQVINTSKGCKTGDIIAGTTSNYSNGVQKVTTLIKTPNPCYKLSSFDLVHNEQNASVYVNLKSKKGTCVQCIGYYKIKYKIRTSRKLDLTVFQVEPLKIKTQPEKANQETTTSEEPESFCGISTKGPCRSDAYCEIQG